jgi:hypothetical protein
MTFRLASTSTESTLTDPSASPKEKLDNFDDANPTLWNEQRRRASLRKLLTRLLGVSADPRALGYRSKSP